MITWARLALTLAQLVSQLVTWLHQSQLISEGEAQEIAKALSEQAASIKAASDARKAVDDKLRSDPSSILQDDGFKRD